MVCGMDIFHKQGTGSKSILAFTASLNQTVTRYWSSAKVQDEGQEISNTLQQIVSEALTEFKAKNGVFPMQMVIYRDGVGDSQQKAVLLYELPQIKLAIQNTTGGKDIKLMMVLCNKRVNQRFFQCDSGNMQGRLQNPLPGTVIDSDIVAPETYDFYMISQQSRQGVVSPTHYIVVHDTILADPVQIQALTYKLCYTYYNVSGSIKVPAPVQYAHRLANLIGDRSTKNKVPLPHDHFGKNVQSLYFI